MGGVNSLEFSFILLYLSFFFYISYFFLLLFFPNTEHQSYIKEKVVVGELRYWIWRNNRGFGATGGINELLVYNIYVSHSILYFSYISYLIWFKYSRSLPVSSSSYQPHEEKKKVLTSVTRNSHTRSKSSVLTGRFGSHLLQFHNF